MGESLLNRFGRDLRHLVNLVHELTGCGVGLRAPAGGVAADESGSERSQLPQRSERGQQLRHLHLEPGTELLHQRTATVRTATRRSAALRPRISVSIPSSAAMRVSASEAIGAAPPLARS
jgi:hypothetical protein